VQNDIAISVSNVFKKYIIGKQKESSLRGSLKGFFNRKSLQGNEFMALNNVSFDIKKGDIVGIIGKNGAGKSTLLKILSQITKPTEGRIEINGRIASLLEVGTGFHPELTGRENIYLNGTILGMTRKEVRSKFDEIVEFSGVEKFIDTAVKHYSSGMYVRLAFAVAAHLEPEILIIDEVLAVGDAEFQKKCLGKMQDVANQGRTVLFVSHNMASVRSLCNKGILLENGQITFQGSAIETLDKYHLQKSVNSQAIIDSSDFTLRSRGPRHIYISKIQLDKLYYSPESKMTISISIMKQSIELEIKNINLSVFIFDNLQNVIYQLSTSFLDEDIHFSSQSSYQFRLDKLNLVPGNYSMGIWLNGNGFEQDYIENQISFDVGPGSIYKNSNPHIVSMIQKEFQFEVINS